MAIQCSSQILSTGSIILDPSPCKCKNVSRVPHHDAKYLENERILKASCPLCGGTWIRSEGSSRGSRDRSRLRLAANHRLSSLHTSASGCPPCFLQHLRSRFGLSSQIWQQRRRKHVSHVQKQTKTASDVTTSSCFGHAMHRETRRVRIKPRGTCKPSPLLEPQQSWRRSTLSKFRNVMQCI